METAVATGQASEVLASLERAWAAIQIQHPQVPDAVIILASGEERGGLLRKWGHFHAKSWKRRTDDAHEVLIAGEGLSRPAGEVFATLLHEAAHALNFACGIKDCSRQGRYHNARFKATAEDMGLVIERAGNIGWSKTTLPDETADRYFEIIEDIRAAQVIYKKSRAVLAAMVGGGEDENGAGRRSTTASCTCGRKIRVGRDVLAEAPITCGACSTEFAFDDE